MGDGIRMRDNFHVTTPVARASGVTERERDVLVLIVGHLTNLEIAERLSLSVRTVESHVSSLIRKLGVSDRRALARRAEVLDLLRPRRLHHWPSPANGFVGRAPEAADLHARMRGHRLVTVTGPGGVGKTRLATHVVEQMAQDRHDGAWFVDLSQVASSDAVVIAVAAAVGVVEPPGQSLDETLAGVLARSDGVLLMDNCEHLLPAVAAYLSGLVASSPRLSVVATSRAPLRSPHEWVYELPGLSSDDAVQLFRMRAEAAGGIVPDDPRAAKICGGLEGNALAIELTAARYPLLGLDGLAAALGNPLRLLGSEDGARQSSLRATISWSVDLLDDEAREMFAALNVFAAPFTVASAHTVARPEQGAADAARVLATLADQHLLYVEPGNPTRYSFQEVVRQYAADQLGAGAEEVQRRHAGWAAGELSSLGSSEHDDAWYERFDELAVEVRAALTRPVADAALRERFAEELVQRGRLEESQHCFETLAEATDGRDRVRSLRLAAGAAAARLVGDETMRLLDEAADAATAAADPNGAADALGWSVIFASFHPGIMANPPDEPEIARRLAEARRLAPAGSTSEATVAAAAAMCLPNDDPEALTAGRGAADQAIAGGQPVVASAALDCVCSGQLSAGEFADALATVRTRGVLMDPMPLGAATAYPFNDYLLMGCEVSLAAGELAGAREYAERLAALPCYRDYAHPALARRFEVDLLSGDLTGAVQRGESFLASWDRAGRHRASTLAVGTYSLALIHGLLGNDTDRDVWRDVTEHLLDGPVGPPDGPAVGWAPTLDAWLHLHRSEPLEAFEVLVADLDDPRWHNSTSSLMWRPWYAAARAEAVALIRGPDLDHELTRAALATQGNPVATALVRRAAALARDDHTGLAALATVLDDLGAHYQRDRSRQLIQ
jgi:predicted ATPase/DNA-binding CsgD family transcriptional regulator